MSLFENKKIEFPGGKKFIKDFQVGEKIDGYFKVFRAEKKSKKDGSAFLTLGLMDKTGKMPAKVWNNAEHYFKLIREGEIYKISGYVNEYMSQKEIKVDGLRALSSADGDINRGDFEEKAAFDTEALFDRMMETVKSNLENPYLAQLAGLFAEEYGEKFKNHYGAQMVHHAYVGGLLHHTYSMVRLALFCAGHYSHLVDKELLITGVLFHDIGKMFEFNVSPAVAATMEGGLLGHLVIGNTVFLELKNKIPDFPEDLSCKIQHLIISHHGEKEFGSPEVPKIPEAFVLNILDLLDSKLNIVETAVKKSETAGLFSDYIKVLGRRLYTPPKQEAQ